MNRFDFLARGLLRPVNPYVATLLGLMTFFWGLFVLCPMFDVFTTAPVFVKALQFAPEWAWASWATACGAVMLFAMYRGPVKLVNFSLGFATWHWLVVSGMFWWGDWQNTAGFTYGCIGVYAAFLWLNIKGNTKKQGITHV